MPIGRFGDSKEVNSIQKEVTKKQEESQWKLEEPQFELKSMILHEETKKQILDVVSFFKNKNLLFHKWGLAEKFSEKKGTAINLYGAPGTGKTMAAHAIANELSLKMICVNYAEIESKYVGETSKNLTSLFNEAEKSGAMIFFDEADALLSKRVTNMTSATDVSVNQTRSVLLTLLNDYTGVIIFATNFIKNFDAAFLRRISFHIKFHLPNREARELLWRNYIPCRMPVDVDYRMLAEKYSNISGSDISTAVFAAAISASKDGVSNKKKEMGEIGIRTSHEIGEKFNRHLSSLESDIASHCHIDKELLTDAAMNFAVDAGVSAAKGGIDFLGNFFGYLRHKGKSFSFKSFLENTGKYFDSLIQNVCSRENARYVGGKLIVEWNEEDDIDMSADFYFLSSQKEWITQKCSGSIDIKYISDWETNCDLMQLRGNKKIEFPITLPK